MGNINMILVIQYNKDSESWISFVLKIVSVSTTNLLTNFWAMAIYYGL